MPDIVMSALTTHKISLTYVVRLFLLKTLCSKGTKCSIFRAEI